MKGKTKTILTIVIAIVIVAIAAVGTVTFLKDNGEASAAEEGTKNQVLPVTGSDNEQNNSGNTANAPENLNGNQTENQGTNEGETVTPGTTQNNNNNSNNTQTRPSQNNNAQTPTEPETTTVEQERLVSTTLTWSGIKLNSANGNISDRNINYTNLNYTIKYYKVLDNEIELLNTEKGKAEFGTTLEVTEKQIEANCPFGYKLDEKSELSVKITENEVANLIEVYYIPKTDVSYTVKYLEKETNKVLAEEELRTDKTFNETYKEPAKEVTGYTVDAAEKSITLDAYNKELVFYYTAKTDVSYTVKYLEKDTNKVLADEELRTNKTFNETCKETAKVVTGYTVDETEKTITLDAYNKELVFYYTANTDVSYKVKYLEKGTDKVLAEEETKTGKTFNETCKETAKVVTGYTVDETEKTITLDAYNKELVFYYTANTYTYTVVYNYEGINGEWVTLPETPTESKTAEYGTVITNEDIAGFDQKTQNNMYIYDHVEPVENGKVHLEISEVTENNVINVYYVRNSFEYKVEYYKDSVNGEKLGETETKAQKVKTVMTEELVTEDFGEEWLNKNKPQVGYKDGEVEEYITIQANNENVIKVVYKPVTDIPYTIEYYYNGVKNEDNTVSGKGSFGERITAENKDNNGEWELEENATLTFTIASVTENVFKVYYVKPDIEVVKTSTPSVKRADSIVEPGETITYTITATNKGKKDGTVKISDTIPTGTTLEGTITATGFDSVSVEELANGITLTVPALEAAKVEFTVRVTGEKFGEEIVNKAKVNDEETSETTVENEVEKTVKIKENTETIKATNIVLVIDSSGSMDEKMDNGDGTFIARCEDANCTKTHRTGWSLFIGNYKYHTKMTTAIDAACRFIDQIYPSQSTNNGTTISVIEFNTQASSVGTMANSYKGAQDLKTTIKKLEANGNTAMGSALNMANNTLTNIPAQYKDNNNVVIFLSDGTPTDGTAYQTAANTLKTGSNKAKIYTIGFEISNEGSQVLSRIASGKEYVFLTDINKLFETFDDISSSIKESSITKQSEDGKIVLNNVNTTKPIKINGTTIELTDKKINKVNDTTYEIILSEFSPSELEKEISIEYFSK